MQYDEDDKCLVTSYFFWDNIWAGVQRNDE